MVISESKDKLVKAEIWQMEVQYMRKHCLYKWIIEIYALCSSIQELLFFKNSEFGSEFLAEICCFR